MLRSPNHSHRATVAREDFKWNKPLGDIIDTVGARVDGAKRRRQAERTAACRTHYSGLSTKGPVIPDSFKASHTDIGGAHGGATKTKMDGNVQPGHEWWNVARK